MTMARLTLTRPDDRHLPLCEGDIMASVLPAGLELAVCMGA